jgi:hypothetical protein
MPLVPERWKLDGNRPATVERTESEIAGLRYSISQLWKQHLEGLFGGPQQRHKTGRTYREQCKGERDHGHGAIRALELISHSTRNSSTRIHTAPNFLSNLPRRLRQHVISRRGRLPKKPSTAIRSTRSKVIGIIENWFEHLSHPPSQVRLRRFANR